MEQGVSHGCHFDGRHLCASIYKLAEVERQLVRFENEALPQATFSVWGTEMTLLERSHITKALEPQEFKDGAVLIKQGEPRDAFFIIVQGKVSCTRDHRCKVAPPVPPFWSASARQCLSAPAKPRHSPGMPGPRCSARQGCASRRETQSHPERHEGPLAPRGFERSKPRYAGADLAHLHHRPGLDETVLKRDCLLTNQPCESTVTAVGEVQVLVLHGARQCLADCRATGEEAGREVNEPSTGPDAPLDASTGPDALPEPSTGPVAPPTPPAEQLRQRVGRRRP